MSARFIACIAIAAVLALVGWLYHTGVLTRPFTGSTAMNPTSAVLFLFISLSFAGLTHFKGSRRIRNTALILAAMVVLIAVLRMAGFWIPFFSHIDQLIFTKRLLSDEIAGNSNRMAGSSAACFVLCGVTLLALGTEQGRRIRIFQGLVLIIGAISLLAEIAYIYRVQEFYGVLRYFPMSVQTATCFLLFAISFLFVTPENGIMQELTGDRTGSIAARRLIPFALTVPILLGWLRLLGSRVYSVEFGVSILVLSIIFCFVFVIWYNAVLLNKRDLLQRRAQLALQENERRYKSLIGEIQDYAIFMVDPFGHIMSWNRGAQKIKGYSEAEIIGRPVSIFYTAEDNEEGVPAHNLMMARRLGHYKTEGWRVRKDGSRFWADVVFTPIYNEARRLEGYAKITRDITERKIAEQKIAYQARMMEDTSDAIFSMDPSFKLVTWNRGAENLYGYTAGEAIGRHALEVFRYPAGEAYRNPVRNQITKTGYWKGEVVHLNKSGKPLDLIMSVSALRDPEGMVEGYVSVCQDITEQKRVEGLLRQFNEDLAGQVRAKSEQLSSVFDRLSEGFMEIDMMGDILYANRMALVMNQKSADTLIGRNFWKLFPTSADNEFGENFRIALAQQENRYFEMFSPSLQMWIECSMYPSPERMSFFFRDITEQWNARETIKRSNQELRALASHLQVIREEERADMAREVHDELGQQLTGLKMDLSWLAKRLQATGNEAIITRMQSTQELLNKTVMTVRKIATELRPSILDDLGLVAAIEWQSQEFEKRSGIKTSFQASPEIGKFPPAMSIALFRICQEALTNVARHSGARHVGICLLQDNGRLVLKVVDDGKGLTQTAPGPTQRKTLGLVGMKERATMMGGQVDIQSEAGKGLSLTVTVPIQAENT